MINTDMRDYDYYLYGDDDGYGQPSLSADVQGSVKMAINTVSQSVQDSILYKESEYIGLTHASVNDKYVIQYGEDKLKVLYVNPKGRYKQVFMARM